MKTRIVSVVSRNLRAVGVVSGRARIPVFLYAHDVQDALATDTFDPTSSKERAKYLAELGDAHPELDVLGEVAPLLVQLAAEAAAASVPGTNGVGNEGEIPADELWPDTVDGARLLNTLVATLRRYVAMPREAVHAVALWIVHTYGADLADFTPYVLAMSPVRECGKTTLIDVCEPLVFRPRRSDGMTAAALYRVIDRVRPTIFLDELDARLAGEGGENLRGVLNSGFKPEGRTTICVGDQHDAKDFRTYCPKLLAGIGRPWDTVLSRSIPVRLARATPRERTRLLKVRGATIRDELAPLRAQCARWIADAREEVNARRLPPVPANLSARQADIWRPLFAIADEAGGRWPVRARAAAEAIHGMAEDEGDLGLLMLADLRVLFADLGASKLSSIAIVTALLEREDRPWSEMPGGRALTQAKLAKLLRPFDLRPGNVRMAERVVKGYELGDLLPVFSRYLTADASDRTQGEVSPEKAATPATQGIGADDTAEVAAVAPTEASDTSARADAADLTHDRDAVADSKVQISFVNGLAASP